MQPAYGGQPPGRYGHGNANGTPFFPPPAGQGPHPGMNGPPQLPSAPGQTADPFGLGPAQGFPHPSSAPYTSYPMPPSQMYQHDMFAPRQPQNTYQMQQWNTPQPMPSGQYDPALAPFRPGLGGPMSYPARPAQGPVSPSGAVLRSSVSGEMGGHGTANVPVSHIDAWPARWELCQQEQHAAREALVRLAAPMGDPEAPPALDLELYNTVNNIREHLSDVTILCRYLQADRTAAWEMVSKLQQKLDDMRTEPDPGPVEKASTRNLAKAHPKLKDAIHKMTHALLGIENEKESLPDPLEPGQANRVDSATNARLWNPDWEKKVTLKLNDDFVTAVATQTVQTEKQNPMSSVPIASLQVDIAKSIAKNYWRHLSQTYAAQISEAAAEKIAARREANKRRGRRETVALHLRQAARLFDAEYKVTGSIRLVDTDLCSDLLSSGEDWDSDGKVESARDGRHLPKGSWARIAPAHRNKTCTAIYYRLASLRDKNDLDDAELGDDEAAAGSANVAGGKKRKPNTVNKSRKRAAVTPRFHAPAGTLTRRSGPAEGKVLPINLISKRWRARGTNSITFPFADPVEGFHDIALGFRQYDFAPGDWEVLNRMTVSDDEDVDRIRNETLGLTSAPGSSTGGSSPASSSSGGA